MPEQTPGRCVAVCAACGVTVDVPTVAGCPPTLTHVDGCPRTGWPITDAIKYDDGTAATETNRTPQESSRGGEHPHLGRIQADERGIDECPCGEPGCGEDARVAGVRALAGLDQDAADRAECIGCALAVGGVDLDPQAGILVEGHDFDEELVRQTLQFAEGGEVVVHSIGPPAPRPTDEREAEHV